jgi:hypothetical protein
MKWIASCIPVFLSLCSVSNAAVIHVPGDYPTIQDGIDAASPGDEVRIAAGVYSGEGNRNLDFAGKDIAVLSESGPEATIIDPGGEGVGFCLSEGLTSAARIEGLTIRSGWAQLAGGCQFAMGGGLVCYRCSPTIRNCIIENCFGYEGGGIFYWALAPGVIEDCIIRSNMAGSENEGSGSGGGIFVRGPVTIARCTIAGNSVTFGQAGGEPSGAGVACSGTARLEDCLIAGNWADEWSGGLGAGVSGHLDMLRCRIVGNSAPGLGAGVAGSGILEDCVIAGNLSSTGGAGIACLDQSSLTLRGCTVSSNYNDGATAGAVPGGGIHCGESSEILAERTILWGNCSVPGAAEAYVGAGGSLTFNCCDVDVAEVEGPGQAIYSDDSLDRDPYFCGPDLCESAPSQEGDYTLAGNSPCLPENSPCGARIGAEGAGCAPTASQATTWGGIKWRFR